MKRLFFPFLFTTFPILFLGGHNGRLVTVGDVAIPCAIALIVVAFMYVAYSRLIHDRWLAGMRVTVVALWFLVFGHVANLIEDLTRNHDLAMTLMLFASWSLVTIAVLMAVRSIKSRDEWGRILNVTSAALVVAAFVPFVGGVTHRSVEATDADVGMRTSELSRPAVARDVYYVIFDRYAGEATLRDFLHYDNSALLDQLRQRGFVIPRRTLGNYPSTTLSLASSLNMAYLNWVSSKLAPDEQSHAPLHDAIATSKVARTFKALGYRIVNIGSWFDATKHSDVADTNVQMDPLSEFDRTFYQSTALRPLFALGALGPRDLPTLHAQIARAQFPAIQRVADTAGPKFVFAHVLLPHPPYVFDETGHRVYSKRTDMQGKHVAYVRQLQYTNTKMLEMIDGILNRSGPKPIVIIQSDEGPHPSYAGISLPNWPAATRDQLLTKYRILNAYYLPGVDPGGVYPEISPVNTFRLIFDDYFGGHLALLPDVALAPKEEQPYAFVPVTPRIRQPDPASTPPPSPSPSASVASRGSAASPAG